MPLASLDHGAISAAACVAVIVVTYPTLWGVAFAWRQRPRGRRRTLGAGTGFRPRSARMGKDRA